MFRWRVLLFALFSLIALTTSAPAYDENTENTSDSLLVTLISHCRNIIVFLKKLIFDKIYSYFMPFYGRKYNSEEADQSLSSDLNGFEVENKVSEDDSADDTGRRAYQPFFPNMFSNIARQFGIPVADDDDHHHSHEHHQLDNAALLQTALLASQNTGSHSDRDREHEQAIQRLNQEVEVAKLKHELDKDSYHRDRERDFMDTSRDKFLERDLVQYHTAQELNRLKNAESSNSKSKNTHKETTVDRYIVPYYNL